MDFNEWYVLIVSLLAFVAVCYFFKRLFSPFTCACGRQFWLCNSIKRHLLHKHSWQ